ncbi:MAG: hypothetical protein FJY10_06020 [Bacteroidetes bacterium]|nr:hypothetical protein [Bacteroidota bacterium]
MQVRTIIPIFLLVLLLIFDGCGKKEESREGSLITKRIQYDVDIKSPDPDLDWWVQNIEGEKRETFIRGLLEKAYSGKYRMYNYFNNPLTAGQAKKIGVRRDSVKLQRSDPPYEEYDTLVVKTLEPHEITRIRFLEEWYFDAGSGEITKKILGVAPMIRSYDDFGEFRGFELLFWMYYDPDYPLK